MEAKSACGYLSICAAIIFSLYFAPQSSAEFYSVDSGFAGGGPQLATQSAECVTTVEAPIKKIVTFAKEKVKNKLPKKRK